MESDPTVRGAHPRDTDGWAAHLGKGRNAGLARPEVAPRTVEMAGQSRRQIWPITNRKREQSCQNFRAQRQETPLNAFPFFSSSFLPSHPNLDNHRRDHGMTTTAPTGKKGCVIPRCWRTKAKKTFLYCLILALFSFPFISQDKNQLLPMRLKPGLWQKVVVVVERCHMVPARFPRNFFCSPDRVVPPLLNYFSRTHFQCRNEA